MHEMTKLVNNDVVHEFKRQKQNPIIEIQIFLLGAAPTFAPVIFDRHAFVRKRMQARVMAKAIAHQFFRSGFVTQVGMHGDSITKSSKMEDFVC